MFQILAYYKANAASAALADIPAVVDPNFTTRNNHFIFTEDYFLKGVGAFGTALSAAQLYDATWNAINIPQIFPITPVIAIGDLPQVRDLRNWPVSIPLNEEVGFNASNSDTMAANDQFGIIWIAPRAEAMVPNLPQSPIGNYGRVLAQFTVTTATTKGSWSADATISISNLIKGGTYCMAAAYLPCSAAIAFRVNFVRAPLYQGRKLLPGMLCQNAYSNKPIQQGQCWQGPFGYFDTFEYPLMALLGNSTAGSATYTGYLDLIYMGQDMLKNQPLIAS